MVVGRSSIDCRVLAKVSGPLRRAVILWLWRAKEWPLQAMSYAKWEQLAELTVEGAHARTVTLPGGFDARRQADQLVITHHED